MPDQALPWIARPASPAVCTFPVPKRRCSTTAHQDAASSGTQASNSKEKVGTDSASKAVSDEPTMAPTELPTAINANRRLPWLLSKQSAMKPQKMVTTNSAKTLVQT